MQEHLLAKAGSMAIKPKYTLVIGYRQVDLNINGYEKHHLYCCIFVT